MWTLASVEPADAGLTFRLLPGTLKTMGCAPRADFVVMCSSLYHFFDKRNEVLATLRDAADEAVIISEPVRNLTSHPFVPIRKLATWLTNPGAGTAESRFDPQSFRDFAFDNNASDYFHEAVDRQAIAVFRRR